MERFDLIENIPADSDLDVWPRCRQILLLDDETAAHGTISFFVPSGTRPAGAPLRDDSKKTCPRDALGNNYLLFQAFENRIGKE